ncbi:hypothetical protein [Halomonas sp.]|uniref:hypothetical protein n=1 Tax=Halomonas sp. TaxID=1486246 RepID=UPI003D0D9049
MKSDLLGRVDEWVGMHVPAEGTEDHETWQAKLTEIAEIENIQDVIDYIESEGLDLNDFFLCGGYEVLSAGLNPQDAPSVLVTELGELIAEKTWPGGSWVNVYLYDGQYFVVDAVKTSVADTEANALKIAGIENGSFDQVSRNKVTPTRSPANEKASARMKAQSKKVQGERKAVLIVVTDWPDGTMAFKFGGAMKAALGIDGQDDMVLIQMSPERIFRVETMVSETEFREAMKSRDVASGGKVLFIEIPKTRW